MCKGVGRFLCMKFRVVEGKPGKAVEIVCGRGVPMKDLITADYVADELRETLHACRVFFA